jgi:hypothetical protein
MAAPEIRRGARYRLGRQGGIALGSAYYEDHGQALSRLA